MASLHPFRALRPLPAQAAAVAAVPYDVVSAAEARTLVEGNDLSFLRVSRAEVELPTGTDPHADVVYATAAANFARLRAAAPLVEEATPSLYVYRLRMGAHEQAGVAGCFSVDEYERDVILKHERTRKDKEDDRTRHILELRAQTGPVFLTYPDSAGVDAIVARVMGADPLFDFTADDGVVHTLWRASEADRDALVTAFARIPALYIADGHHRAASAMRARAGAARGGGRRRPARGRHVPRGRLPGRPDAGPAVPPPGQGPRGPHRGRAPGRAPGDPRRRARHRHARWPGRGLDVPRRPLARGPAPARRARRRRRGPAGRLAPRGPGPGAPPGDRGPADGHADRLRRRHPRARPRSRRPSMAARQPSPSRCTRSASRT